MKKVEFIENELRSFLIPEFKVYNYKRFKLSSRNAHVKANEGLRELEKQNFQHAVDCLLECAGFAAGGIKYSREAIRKMGKQIGQFCFSCTGCKLVQSTGDFVCVPYDIDLPPEGDLYCEGDPVFLEERVWT